MTDPKSSQAPATGTEGASGAPRFGLGDQVAMQQQQQKQSKVLWGIFGVLVVLAGGVFFVLPRYVAPVQPAAPVVLTPPVQGSTAATPAMSPFEEAQRLHQREAAQGAFALAACWMPNIKSTQTVSLSSQFWRVQITFTLLLLTRLPPSCTSDSASSAARSSRIRLCTRK